MVIASFRGWWGVCVLQQFLFMNLDPAAWCILSGCVAWHGFRGSLEKFFDLVWSSF